MNKIKQILSLVTCLMILLSVAVLRSNKIWGNQLGGEKTEVADSRQDPSSRTTMEVWW